MGTWSSYQNRYYVRWGNHSCLFCYQQLTKSFHQVFCTEDGESVPSVALEIPLKDFAPPGITDPLDLPHFNIFISSESLCRLIVVAKNFMPNQQGTEKVKVEHRGRKRRRSRSPAEELAPEHEARFQLEELHADEIASDDDDSYKENSEETSEESS